MPINDDGKERTRSFPMESLLQVLQEMGKIQFSLSVDKFTSFILNIKYIFMVNILLLQIKWKLIFRTFTKDIFKIDCPK